VSEFTCLAYTMYTGYRVYYESIKREPKIRGIYKSVGVMKDYKLKQRNLLVSHTLGWSWNWNT
jgi:hypothetical protein